MDSYSRNGYGSGRRIYATYKEVRVMKKNCKVGYVGETGHNVGRVRRTNAAWERRDLELRDTGKVMRGRRSMVQWRSEQE